MQKICSMSHTLLPCLFIVLSFRVFSQIEINGVIADKENPLPYANIEVYDSTQSELVTYAISDHSGAFRLSIPKGVYWFRCSYLGYHPITERKAIDKKSIINFTLKEDSQVLTEVVVESEALDVSVDNDTTTYNLEKLTSGSEENLKDIINKLPGVEIDDNGKIKANGKKIDKLLIDGKEFFGDQHQMATHNISSEMVKGISLLKNFKDLSSIDSQSLTGKVAMNIEINEEYIGQIKGNVALQGGYKERYNANTTLFSFGKKSNFFFIGNINDLGNQTFTIEDYISFQGGVQKFLGNNSVSSSNSISGDDLPSYLFANNNVQSMLEKFGAINFSHSPTDKFQINSYVILDKTDISERQTSTQTYFTKSKNIVLNNNTNKENAFLVSNSFLEATYKPTSRSVVSYLLNYSPHKNNLENNDIFNKRSFKEIRNQNGFTLNQVIKYRQKIGRKSILSSSVYHSIIDNDRPLHITSNQPFLKLSFPDKIFSSKQEIKNKNKNFGLDNEFTINLIKNNSIRLRHNISHQKDNFVSTIQNNNLSNHSTIDRLENQLGIGIFKKDRSLVNYDIGVNYSIITANYFNNHFYLPYISFKLNFTNRHYFNISYNHSVKYPQSKMIIKNKFISNYNTLINNKNIDINSISKYKNINFNYFIYDLFSKTLLSLGGSVTLGDNVPSTDTDNSIDFRTNFYTLASSSQVMNAHLILDKKSSKIPFGLMLKGLYSYAKNINFIEGTTNEFRSNQITNDLKISSLFRKSIVNFEVGYRTRIGLINNDNLNISRDIILKNPYANLFINFENINFQLRASREDYQSDALKTVIHNLSPKIVYAKRGSKWKFDITGNNITNINNYNIIENQSRDNFFEERTIASMAGYIVAGITYKF